MIFSFFSFFSVLALNVKHFAQNDLGCQIKYEKKQRILFLTLNLPYIQKKLLAENFATTLWLSIFASFISLVVCIERNWLVKNLLIFPNIPAALCDAHDVMNYKKRTAQESPYFISKNTKAII